MKLTILITTIAFLQVSAGTLAQKISLKGNEISLKKALQSIKKQSGYALFFNNTLVEQAGSANVDLKDATLDQALSEVLKGKPFSYTIIDKTIVIKEKPEGLMDKIIKYLAIPITIHGKVTDDKGLPIPGATVLLKDRSQATTTDVNGNFFMQGVSDKAVVVISSIGFLSKELNVKAEMGTITLEISNSKLDEVVVVGYETTTRRLSTGSVSQVTSKELDQQPVSNPILGLEGRVAGAFITQTSGYAGAPFNIQIRGQNSIANLNIDAGAPLYVINGIPFNSKPVERTVGAFSITPSISPLSTIDPTDIETIDILKDADATAIYGSRGANGVVLITTKKGKAGNTKVNVDFSSGFGNVTHTIPLLGTDQYLSIRRQAFANDAIISNGTVVPTASNASDLTVYDQHAYTDFTKLVMGNTQHQTKATFDISGGDQFTQFLFGGNYRHESTILPTNAGDDGVQFHLNMQHHSHDNKFGALVSVSYNVDNNAVPNYTLSTGNYGLPPNFPIYTNTGAYNWSGGYTNPLAPFNATYALKSNNMVTNATLHYMVIPGLDLKVNAGYNYDNVNSTYIAPIAAANPAFNPTPSVTLGNNYIKTYIIEPQATYTHTWGKGKLTAIVGGTWQETQTVQPYYILGIYSNIQLVNSLNATTILLKTSGYTDYKYDSGFARAEYAWDDKYLVSANIRRDGSSRFGSNKPFGNFGSGAFAWIFSKENFAKNLTWLSFGKLKTSYGSVGNDKVLQDYSYLSTYSSAQFSYGPTTALAPTSISNPNLQWEQTSKLDVAMELGFLHDRIFFSADAYRNRTSHLLGTTPLPPHDGFSSLSAANLPDGAIVQNQGLELELTTVNIKNKGIRWTSSLNFTIPQNKLAAFPNLANNPSYANSYVIGQSLNTRFVYHSTGIVNGVATVQDVNNDGKITAAYLANGTGDYIIDGNSDPKFYGGLDNTISYKGLTLDFLFQFVKRTAQRGDLLGYPGTANNIAQSILDLPFKYSATFGTAYPTNFYSYYTQSDAAIQDASFLRLKNVSLSYNVPQVWAKKLRMSTFQVYLHGQNLLTFTHYKGYDPETLSSIAEPTLRMIVTGVKITF
ncbi:SusC/RagA family TonB-linked outer membrane protein [Mucilaginibacter paludis]|nr:SusC/RagA family TonB-linked outer membrane protein [Mucilaginibacter paludis]